jgi:uncharacterized protein (TIGR03643 family)
MLPNEDTSRIIEMAWEDRTPFEGIYKAYGINEKEVVKIMRKNLRLSSFILWRKRVRNRKTKHSVINSIQYLRHQSKIHNKYR